MAEDLDNATIAACSSQASFQRGQAYYREGRVRDFMADGQVCHATVAGTEQYTVTVDLGNLDGDCDCYAFDGDLWCKHMVAVALTAVGGQASANSGQAATSTGRKRTTEPPLGELLDTADTQQLRAALERVAERYPDTVRQIRDVLNPPSLSTEMEIVSRVKGLLRPVKQARSWHRSVDAASDADDGMRDIAARVPETAAAARGLLAAAHYVYGQLAQIDDSDGALQDGCEALCLRAIAIAGKTEGFGILQEALMQGGDLPLADCILASGDKPMAETLVTQLDKHLYKRDQNLPGISQDSALYMLAHYYAATGDVRLHDLVKEHAFHPNSITPLMAGFYEKRQEWPELAALLWAGRRDGMQYGPYGQLLRQALEKTGQTDKLVTLQVEEALHGYDDIRRSLPRLRHVLAQYGQTGRLPDVVEKLVASKRLPLDQRLWLLLQERRYAEAADCMLAALRQDADERKRQSWSPSPYGVVDIVSEYARELEASDRNRAVAVWKDLFSREADRVLGSSRYERFEQFGSELVRLGQGNFVQELACTIAEGYPTRKKLVQICRQWLGS